MDNLKDLETALMAHPEADPFRHTEGYVEACVNACDGADDPQPGELARLRAEVERLTDDNEYLRRCADAHVWPLP